MEVILIVSIVVVALVAGYFCTGLSNVAGTVFERKSTVEKKSK